MLVLRGLQKSFGGKAVLKDLNLEIPPGQSHVLLGSSGSGKTTLLRIILGLLAPDRGQIELRDKTPTADPHWSQNFGYVPQAASLFPHLTAAQNASIAAKNLRWPKAKIRSRLEEVAKIVALDKSFLGQRPWQLSGGQNQRVAIMRAAFLDPEVLLLDEPLGALDPVLRAEVQGELKSIFQRLNKTVLLITHDLNEAEIFGEQISLLKEGRLLQTGTYAELRDRPADPYVSLFLQAQGRGH